MSIKNLILNKGWAGKTLSRPKTIERVNALIKPLIELMYCYDRLAQSSPAVLDDADWKSALSALRADVGKLSETVFSNGGVAYSGTDLEPESFSSDSDVAALMRREASFAQLLADESQVEHQIRTRAVIGAVAANSDARRGMLNSTAPGT